MELEGAASGSDTARMALGKENPVPSGEFFVVVGAAQDIGLDSGLAFIKKYRVNF